MGGNALKVLTKRFNKSEYNAAASYISLTLKSYGIKHYITNSYSKKEDFGDLDVLISTENIEDNDGMFDLINRAFISKEIKRNKSVISFDYNEFQIDFILINDKHWSASKVYYSYNDLGNLMGRIAYKMGFRYGHEGLRIDHNSSYGGKKLKIYISHDPEQIFTFLGFDYNLFLNGFNTLEDIFRYVLFSKYFTSKIFQYESLNHQNKTRNKKRVNYKGFLQYIADESKYMPLNLGFPVHDFINEAEKYFNVEIKSQIEAFDNKIISEKRNDITKEKLNVVSIQEFFDITGKELGIAIYKFKKEVQIEFGISWQEFLIQNTIVDIMAHFGKYNNLKSKIENND
jgi:hypothetical protein